jgi:integrase
MAAKEKLSNAFLRRVHDGKVKLTRKDGTPASKKLFSDGGGLMLHVAASGGASWIYRFQVGGAPADGGKRYDIGLGPLSDDIDGARARRKAAEHRAALSEGTRPTPARVERRKAATGLTFREAADMRYTKMQAEGKSKKHLTDWNGTMATWVFPIIGDMDVRHIDVEDIERVMMQVIDNTDDKHHGGVFWLTKRVTAKKALGKIYQALQIAIARKARADDNPASWRDKMQTILPAQNHTVTHVDSLPWKALPAFMKRLQGAAGIGALALRFTILTASRTGPVRHVVWGDISMAERVWDIDKQHMKVKTAGHRVPLCDGAMEVLKVLRALPGCDTSPDSLVFPSSKPGAPVSDMTLTACIRRLGEDCTTHGFRATWKTYLMTKTNHDHTLIEHSLHHKVGDKVAMAYLRDDMMDRRRALFDDFGRFASSNDV